MYKAYRTLLMKSRGGTALFHIESGRWRGVPREERFARNVLLVTLKMSSIGFSTVIHGKPCSRVILFEEVEAHLSVDDFACLDDDQKIVVILHLACKIPSIMKAIICLWTDSSASLNCLS